MRLREKFSTLARGYAAMRRRKGAAGLATIGAIVGATIGSYLFPSDRPLDYFLFATVGVLSAVVGGAIGYLLPEPRSAKWAGGAQKGLIRIAGAGGTLMAIASFVKLLETGDPAFLAAVVAFSSCGIGGFGFPNRLAEAVAFFGIAAAAFLLFVTRGEIFGILAGIFCIWVATRFLKAPSANLASDS